MFGTIRTLMAGANARAEEQVRDIYSIELIDQKIREAEAGLKSAKYALAGLIQRERAERRQIEALEARSEDLLARAREAMQEGREDLGTQAAQAVADMENELTLRRETTARLETRILQLRQSVERANRRLIDLRQGAVAARAVRKEQDIQRKLGRHIQSETPFEEAEELIARVMRRDDPFEQGEILREIDEGLQGEGMTQRMAEAGFGAPTKITAGDVLSRIRT